MEIPAIHFTEEGFVRVRNVFQVDFGSIGKFIATKSNDNSLVKIIFKNVEGDNIIGWFNIYSGRYYNVNEDDPTSQPTLMENGKNHNESGYIIANEIIFPYEKTHFQDNYGYIIESEDSKQSQTFMDVVNESIDYVEEKPKRKRKTKRIKN